MTQKNKKKKNKTKKRRNKKICKHHDCSKIGKKNPHGLISNLPAMTKTKHIQIKQLYTNKFMFVHLINHNAITEIFGLDDDDDDCFCCCCYYACPNDNSVNFQLSIIIH